MSELSDKIIDVHNRGLAEHDKELFATIFAPDVAVELPGAAFEGIEGLLQTIEVFYTAFPDIELTPRQVWADETGVVAEQVFTGTHNGPLVSADGEVAPTGKAVTFGLIDTFVVNDEGQVTAHRVYYDQLAFLSQLGLA
ncbi:MAG: ester cyclase [Gordonia sp. (in: high G+C Gram-positive bacteria)]|uniref:ester cyclase n=1 Tax=Gordonia sp. (in: high G+C Gram-positive bacteria) TaxID=84139 RepID=UPI0039E5C3E2